MTDHAANPRDEGHDEYEKHIANVRKWGEYMAHVQQIRVELSAAADAMEWMGRAMRGDEDTAWQRRAVIGHVAFQSCECDPETGAQPCVACAMGLVLEWSKGIDAALGVEGGQDDG